MDGTCPAKWDRDKNCPAKWGAKYFKNSPHVRFTCGPNIPQSWCVSAIPKRSNKGERKMVG